ncbi:MAG: glycosyltransferase [Actinomycetota bacterium]|nr:glycosyltransferase [Actinomycetota bacterium]
MRILTWHVHGSYLWYLSHVPHDLFVPTQPGAPPGYAGRAGTLPWPANLHEVPAGEVAGLDVDVVVFQSVRNWTDDQYEILSPAQRAGPRIYLEHDPPRDSPYDTSHPVTDPGVLVVHVTAFNRLMWDNGPVPTAVVGHGVVLPTPVTYSGEIRKGLVAVNHLAGRGRRLGADVFAAVRERVPLDLVGMGSEELGGLGEIPPPGLGPFAARYRFFFNPIRWTSLGLAVCEAMMAGVPIVGLATTEMAAVIEDGVSGYVDTDVDRLIAGMESLLADRQLAAQLGAGARRAALARFSIDRFVADWNRVLAAVASGQPRSAATVATRSSMAPTTGDPGVVPLTTTENTARRPPAVVR